MLVPIYTAMLTPGSQYNILNVCITQILQYLGHTKVVEMEVIFNLDYLKNNWLIIEVVI